MFVVVETMADAFPLPNTASSWMFKHLDQLNIVYDYKPTELSDFMTLLKKRHGQRPLDNSNLSDKQKRLLDYTKTDWKLSFDFDIKRTGGKRKPQDVQAQQKRKIDAGIKEAEDFMNELLNENLEVFSEFKER